MLACSLLNEYPPVVYRPAVQCACCQGVWMTVASERIRGYDIARAVAIMVMVVVNFSSMMEVTSYPWDWLKTVVEFLYGRAATLFIMLAGLSVALLAARCTAFEASQALRLRLVKRSALLMVAGLVLWQWWEADILHYYALYLTLSAGIVFFSDKWLRRLTLAVMLLSVPVSALLTAGYDMSDRIVFDENLPPGAELLWGYLAGDYYSLLPWMAFFLVGMLLGRREPADAAFYKRCAWLGALVCCGVELFSGIAMSRAYALDWEIEGNLWLTFFRSDAFPATPLFLFSSGAGAVALIGLCRLTVAAQPRRGLRWAQPLAVFGRFSLTMYIGHLLWGAGFIAWVHDSDAEITAGRMFLAAAAFYAAGISFAWVWQRFFRRGPLETVFHFITKDRAADAAVPAVCPVRSAVDPVVLKTTSKAGKIFSNQ